MDLYLVRNNIHAKVHRISHTTMGGITVSVCGIRMVQYAERVPVADVEDRDRCKRCDR